MANFFSFKYIENFLEEINEDLETIFEPEEKEVHICKICNEEIPEKYCENQFVDGKNNDTKCIHCNRHFVRVKVEG
ncbi:hypothetical protein H3N56_00170 [Cetobacterium sp. 2A]|uniref:hypothetical protein n=1 Tax=unclassified Cetobacterium TaxID=2630983 RepID=UPI00163D0600|nr:hypothetical protein [Cetobacterium sp. 2A]MBC2854919.1 hypothetical protein [Cetobacterium sp. 2A]